MDEGFGKIWSKQIWWRRERQEDKIYELDLTETSNVQVEHTELTENELVMRSEMQIVIYQEVQKRATAARKEEITQIVWDTPIDVFHVAYNANKERVKSQSSTSLWKHL